MWLKNITFSFLIIKVIYYYYRKFKSTTIIKTPVILPPETISYLMVFHYCFYLSFSIIHLSIYPKLEL